MFSFLILHGLSPVFSSLSHSLLLPASMRPYLFLSPLCLLTAHHPAINVGVLQGWASPPHCICSLSSGVISSMTLTSLATIYQWPKAIDLRTRPLLFASVPAIWSPIPCPSLDSQSISNSLCPELNEWRNLSPSLQPLFLRSPLAVNSMSTHPLAQARNMEVLFEELLFLCWPRSSLLWRTMDLTS